MKHEDTYDSLIEILSSEYTALISGDIEGCLEISDQKHRLVANLQTIKLTTDQATNLHKAFNRNQYLLTASSAGLRDFLDRVTTFTNMHDKMVTYTKSGNLNRKASYDEKQMKLRS